MAFISIAMPSALDLELPQGTDINEDVFYFVWKTGPKGTEQAVDLTGWKAKAQFKHRAKDLEPLLELDTESGGIVLNYPVTGSIAYLIDNTKTSAFSKLDGVHGLKMIDPNGNVRTLFEGSFKIKREIVNV